MKPYQWIVLKIQDLSTAEFIHSIVDDDYSSYEDNVFELSAKPLQYFVPANDFDALFNAKEIMEASLTNIYEVRAVSGEYETIKDPDGDYEEQKVEVKPVYLDSFTYYNAGVREHLQTIALDKAKKQKKAKPSDPFKFPAKKLPKNRFQIIETFTNDMPQFIRRYKYEDDDQ
jgi:hypothetical protein